MGREKTISDQAVFGSIRELLASDGERSVSFASIAQATGLAPPTLVQRYGTRAGMVKAAQLAAWDALDLATIVAVATGVSKGPQAVLKALSSTPGAGFDLIPMVQDMRDGDLRLRAARWRATVESALSLRLGGGGKGRAAAQLWFAAWQGQLLWAAAGGKGFRLKDAVKQLI